MKHQENFAALDISEPRDVDWMQKIVDDDSFSGIFQNKCEPQKLDQESSTSDQEKVRAILDSWEEYIAYEIERTREDKAGTCTTTSTTYSEQVFEPLKRIYNSGPPKRFHRRGAM